MIGSKQTRSLLIGAAICTGAVFAATALASPPSDPSLTNVRTANTKSDGFSPASKLSKELAQIVVAQGSTRLENTSALTSYYGYDNDVLNAAGEPQMVPTPTNPTTEAHKTEPDKNTYLVFKHGLAGADAGYDYGRHFLFQGHEGGANGAGYITRINLDADAEHRVTLLATTDVNGNPLATIDGSTWDPWAKRLLFTTENKNAPTYAATPGYPSAVTDISGALGRGGYEGIQNDSDGNIWIVEDIGGDFKTDASAAPTKAKRPNSFVYRYVPAHPGDLQHGKLQALQVLNGHGDPITFASQAALNNPDQVALHSYGNTLDTKWVTIHNTATDGSAPFIANDLAKAANATPFKRPENGASSSPARISRSSSSTRRAIPTRPARRTTPPAAGARSSCSSRTRRRAPTPAPCPSCTNVIRSTAGFNNYATSLCRTTGLTVRRGRRRHAARAAQRPRLQAPSVQTSTSTIRTQG